MSSTPFPPCHDLSCTHRGHIRRSCNSHTRPSEHSTTIITYSGSNKIFKAPTENRYGNLLELQANMADLRRYCNPFREPGFHPYTYPGSFWSPTGARQLGSRFPDWAHSASYVHSSNRRPAREQVGSADRWTRVEGGRYTCPAPYDRCAGPRWSGVKTWDAHYDEYYAAHPEPPDHYLQR